jgi:outer membrane protein TolC
MKQRSLFQKSKSVVVALWARNASAHLRFFITILIVCFASPAYAITLETVLQTTLEKNPAIQEAKSGLEQAAGQRLVFRSVVWPDIELGVPAGVQGGHRAGESGTKGFALGRGVLTQTLFNAGLPASLRRGDIEVLIAQQQLNVAVVEQLHAARLAFYAALYNRSLESIRRQQQQRLRENVATQRTRFEAGLADKSALTSATVQASELDTQIQGAHRAYLDAQLQLALAMAIDPAKVSLPEPEGDLQSIWILKQQGLYSGGPILDLRVYSCARPTKINGLSRPTTIPS